MDWFSRLPQPGWSRSILTVLGLTALVLGAVNAWRAQASTALLIVGAVLVIAGLVAAQEWRELTARHGEAELRLLRGYREEVRESVVESTTLEELQVRIAELETTAQAAESEKRSAQMRRELAAAVVKFQRESEEALDPAKPETSAAVTQDGVLLTLRIKASPGKMPPASALCRVTAPGGQTTEAQVSSKMGLVFLVRSFSVLYPREFADSPPLIAGEYRVEWTQTSSVWVALAGSPLNVETSFTLTEENLPAVAPA